MAKLQAKGPSVKYDGVELIYRPQDGDPITVIVKRVALEDNLGFATPDYAKRLSLDECQQLVEANLPELLPVVEERFREGPIESPPGEKLVMTVVSVDLAPSRVQLLDVLGTT